MIIQTQSFYYKFNRLNFWLLLNIVLFLMIVCCCCRFPSLLFWPQTQVFIGVFVFSCLSWGFKYVKRHRLALIDNESICIDHCKPLFWKDVAEAEEKVVRCCCRKMPVIVLKIKENTPYEYNFLQKHNGDFTPFSIPLYGVISKEDEEELIRIIAQKVPLKRLKP